MPIPSDDKDSYDDLCYNGTPYSRILQQLAPKKTFEHCHVDPDIRDECRAKSIEGWKPGFGQSGSAQGVLDNAGVEPGDLFLFFGWFRKVELYNGCYRFIRTSRGGFYDHSDMHVIYGAICRSGRSLPQKTGYQSILGTHMHQTATSAMVQMLSTYQQSIFHSCQDAKAMAHLTTVWIAC